MKKYITKIFDKYNLFKAFLVSFLLLILLAFLYAFVFEFAFNGTISYFYGYIIFLLITFKYGKDYIKKEFKEFKELKIKDIFKIFGISLIITTVAVIINLIIIKYIGHIAATEKTNEDILKAKPILSCINMIILGPIVEEIIFRYPYKFINKNRLLVYITYSIIFALCHVNFTNTSDIIFLIPYTLISFGIGYNLYKSNNLLMSILYHIFNNFITIMILLFI